MQQTQEGGPRMNVAGCPESDGWFYTDLQGIVQGCASLFLIIFSHRHI
jgi:hypothetical protein